MSLFPGLQFLTAYEKAMIQSEVHELIDCTNLGSGTCTYRRFTATGSATFAPSTGVVTTPYTSTTSVPVMAGPVTERDAALLDIEMRATDKKFLIRISDLSATPTDRDLIVYGGTTFDIYKVFTDQVSGAAVLVAKVSAGE